MARPSKLTPAVQSRILELVSAGVHPDVAAGTCGVSRATLYEWARRAAGRDRRKPTPELVAFAEALEIAISSAEARLVLKLAEFVDGRRRGKRKPWVKSRMTMAQVSAMQWTLARRFPERWGGGGSVHVNPEPEGGGRSGSSVRIVYSFESAPEPELAAGPYDPDLERTRHARPARR